MGPAHPRVPPWLAARDPREVKGPAYTFRLTEKPRPSVPVDMGDD